MMPALTEMFRCVVAASKRTGRVCERSRAWERVTSREAQLPAPFISFSQNRESSIYSKCGMFRHLNKEER